MEGRIFRISTLFSATVLSLKATTAQEICCTYQFQDHCFSDCHRKDTHRVLPAADLATLHTFVKDNIVVPDVRTDPPEVRDVGQPLQTGSRPHLHLYEPSVPPPIIAEINKLEKLGKFIKPGTNFYVDKASWSEIFHAMKGRSNFSEHLARLSHKAAPLLSQFEKIDIPFILPTKPWNLNHKDAAIN